MIIFISNKPQYLKNEALNRTVVDADLKYLTSYLKIKCFFLN